MQHALNRGVHRRTHAHVQQFDLSLCSLRVSLTPAETLVFANLQWLFFFNHTAVKSRLCRCKIPLKLSTNRNQSSINYIYIKLFGEIKYTCMYGKKVSSKLAAIIILGSRTSIFYMLVMYSLNIKPFYSTDYNLSLTVQMCVKCTNSVELATSC